MRFHLAPALNSESDLIVLGLFEDDVEKYRTLETDFAKEIVDAVAKNVLVPAKFGTTYATKLHAGKNPRVLLVALGKKDEFTLEKVRRVMSRAVKYARGYKITSFSTNLAFVASSLFTAEDLGCAMAEGAVLAGYSFRKYLSTPEEERPKAIEHVWLQWDGGEELVDGLVRGRVIADATNFTRDLVNEPAGVATPTFLENIARQISLEKNLKVTVLEKDDMQAAGMGAILGVSQGSDHPPKLILLEYTPVADAPLTALVGKGITFDSGGLHLKPTGSIETMKSDMAGAAVVLATIKALAELGVQKNVIGVVPSCENTINGLALKPGDIVIAHNKKSIEITNTDAEGRLILADAMSYAEERYKPETIIDIATLTGACVTALGYQISGIISPDAELLDAVKDAGEKSYDRVWPLPLLEEYQNSMDGTISDLVNSGARTHGAGAITAAVFLRKFVNSAKWAHIDIAGPSFLLDEKEYHPKGATGAGTRLLIYYFLQN